MRIVYNGYSERERDLLTIESPVKGGKRYIMFKKVTVIASTGTHGFMTKLRSIDNRHAYAVPTTDDHIKGFAFPAKVMSMVFANIGKTIEFTDRGVVYHIHCHAE